MLVNSVSASGINSNSAKSNVRRNGLRIAFRGGESIWTTAKANIENAAQKLGLDKALTNEIVYPECEASGYVHVKGIDEPIQVFRTQHGRLFGPAKGGIRMMPNVNAETVRGLSAEMLMKVLLAGLDLGGGKGGIRFDASKLNPQQREELFRGYTRLFYDFIGPDKDIPAPDMFTNARDMDTIMDEYSRLKGYPVPGVVTGKSLANGGSLGRREATGLGVVHTIEEALAKLGITQKQATAAVQGSGNVGGVAAQFLHDRGVKVVGMSDMYGAIYNEKGLNVPEVLQEIAQKGTLTQYSKAGAISNADLLGLKVDVLVPAATQGQITDKNAGSILAKIIAEGANGPTTPAADKILTKRGIHVIPDVLANQGGVFVSHLEHIQNITKDRWTLQAVLDRLAAQMKSRYNAVFEFARNNKVTMREAATMLAVERIAKALEARRGRWI